jgi:hypothetical protein
MNYLLLIVIPAFWEMALGKNFGDISSNQEELLICP